MVKPMPTYKFKKYTPLKPMLTYDIYIHYLLEVAECLDPCPPMSLKIAITKLMPTYVITNSRNEAHAHIWH